MERINWNDELVTQEIGKVMKALCIDHMPSNTQIKFVNNDSTLQNAIRRRGGLYQMARKLNLQIKPSETEIGDKFERIAIERLKSLNYSVERMGIKHPYDLLIESCVKIDIKVAKEYLNNGSKAHTVGINKRNATCDIYIIYLIDDSDNIQKTLIIPGHHLKLTSLNMGNISKYDKYIDEWGYLQQFTEFYKSI